MKKLRILMVIAAFYPYIGGAEKQVQKLSNELIKRGIEVSVVTGRWNSNLKKVEIINGLRIYRNCANLNFINKEKLDVKEGIFNTGSIKKTAKPRKIKIFLMKLSFRLRVYIYQLSLFFFLLVNKRNYDMIHVHQVLYPAFISVICSRILKKPVIAKVGNSGFNSDINQLKKFPEGKLQLRYIIRNVNKIVCTTSIMSEEFLNEGLSHEKIILIHNGVMVNDFIRSYNNCDNILYVGRFIKNKNIEILISAFSIIINEVNNSAKLFLIGDGPERDKITAQIYENGLENSITLTGMVDNTEKFLKDSDVFILPSLVEGLSNSLIEAMSYKMPCIISDIEGNREVLGNVSSHYAIEPGSFLEAGSGLLFNPTDIGGLVNAYRHLHRDGKIRQEMGSKAYDRIKSEFDIRIIAEKYTELYKGLLK
jgi:glycosyltransferase involved in cell wall biosynthesis